MLGGVASFAYYFSNGLFNFVFCNFCIWHMGKNEEKAQNGENGIEINAIREVKIN